MSRSVVVLPAPFGPSSPKTDPAGTSRSSPSTARTPVRPAEPLGQRRGSVTGAPPLIASSRPTGESTGSGRSALMKQMIRPHSELAVALHLALGRSRSRSAKTIRPISIAMTGEQQQEQLGSLMPCASPGRPSRPGTSSANTTTSRITIAGRRSDGQHCGATPMQAEHDEHEALETNSRPPRRWVRCHEGRSSASTACGCPIEVVRAHLRQVVADDDEQRTDADQHDARDVESRPERRGDRSATWTHAQQR